MKKITHYTLLLNKNEPSSKKVLLQTTNKRNKLLPAFQCTI